MAGSPVIAAHQARTLWIARGPVQAGAIGTPALGLGVKPVYDLHNRHARFEEVAEPMASDFPTVSSEVVKLIRSHINENNPLPLPTLGQATALANDSTAIDMPQIRCPGCDRISKSGALSCLHECGTQFTYGIWTKANAVAGDEEDTRYVQVDLPEKYFFAKYSFDFKRMLQKRLQRDWRDGSKDAYWEIVKTRSIRRVIVLATPGEPWG